MPNHILAICLDSGDTLVDEGTEIKDAAGVVLQANLIPGAKTLVRALKTRGYPLALIADGPPGSFENVLGHYGLYDAFDVTAISGLVGVEKPDARIFRYALAELGIAAKDYGRVLMVGNNLERDIRGANELGLVSVWLDWAPRRSKLPRNELEVPQYTIKQPLDLLPLLDELENSYRANQSAT